MKSVSELLKESVVPAATRAAMAQALEDGTFGFKYAEIVRAENLNHLTGDQVADLELNILGGQKLVDDVLGRRPQPEISTRGFVRAINNTSRLVLDRLVARRAGNMAGVAVHNMLSRVAKDQWKRITLCNRARSAAQRQAPRFRRRRQPPAVGRPSDSALSLMYEAVRNVRPITAAELVTLGRASALAVHDSDSLVSLTAGTMAYGEAVNSQVMGNDLSLIQGRDLSDEEVSDVPDCYPSVIDAVNVDEQNIRRSPSLHSTSASEDIPVPSDSTTEEVVEEISSTAAAAPLFKDIKKAFAFPNEEISLTSSDEGSAIHLPTLSSHLTKREVTKPAHVDPHLSDSSSSTLNFYTCPDSSADEQLSGAERSGRKRKSSNVADAGDIKRTRRETSQVEVEAEPEASTSGLKRHLPSAAEEEVVQVKHARRDD